MKHDDVGYGDMVDDLIIGIKKLETAMAYMISTYSGVWTTFLVPYISSETILGEMLSRISYWTSTKCRLDEIDLDNGKNECKYKCRLDIPDVNKNKKRSKSLFYIKHIKHCMLGYEVMLLLLDSVHLTKGECFFHYDIDYWVDLISNNKRKMVFNKNLLKNFDIKVASIITELIKDIILKKEFEHTALFYIDDTNIEHEIPQLRKRKICDEEVFNFLASKYNEEVVEYQDVVVSD